ncbi:MAG: glycosyltransferase family 10 [Elainellaceae cyanobacterium]
MASGKYTVGMISSYVGLTPCPVDWLWHQTPHPFGQWRQIQMQARSPQPDILLMYNFTSFPTPPLPCRNWFRYRKQQAQYQDSLAAMPQALRGVPQERSLFLLREPPLDEVVAKNRRFYRQAQDYCGYVSGPDNDAPTPDYMPAIWYVKAPFQYLNEMPPPPKYRSCSWITSGIARTENHRRRLAFLHQLRAAQLDFDLYGRGLPDSAQPHGELSNKLHGMAPYYYNLSIENYADNEWYVSEKLWDALLSWCLPIYYGGSAADKLLPPGSFLRLPSLDEAGIQFIQSVTASPDAWYEAREAIAEARQIILHKLNLMEWLSSYAQNFV